MDNFDEIPPPGRFGERQEPAVPPPPPVPNIPAIPENAAPTCHVCRSPVNAGHAFCGNCGYPLQGSDQDKARFIGGIAMRKSKLAEAKKAAA